MLLSPSLMAVPPHHYQSFSMVWVRSGDMCVPQCVTCNLCGCGSLLDFIFSGAACAWWAAASLVFGKYATQANDKGLPEAQWRGWIIIVSWVQAGLFILIAGVSLIRYGYGTSLGPHGAHVLGQGLSSLPFRGRLQSMCRSWGCALPRDSVAGLGCSVVLCALSQRQRGGDGP